MDISFILAQAESAGFDAESFSNLAPPIKIALFLGAMSFATAALVSLTAFYTDHHCVVVCASRTIDSRDSS